MSQRFRDDFDEVLIEWVARARRSVTGRADLGFEVLSPPHRNSPFLTLAEHLGGGPGGLPSRVLKLLPVLADDPSEPFWREILKRERDRWRDELRRRLTLPHRVALVALPLSAPRSGAGGLVEIADIGPLRRSDLLVGAPPESNVRFRYLVRPFIAWPRLRDVGYSADELKERWETFCDERGVAPRLREPLFVHFCDEALTNGRGDLLLTSAWRLDVLR